jgi:hypothetical protein
VGDSPMSLCRELAPDAYSVKAHLFPASNNLNAAGDRPNPWNYVEDGASLDGRMDWAG